MDPVLFISAIIAFLILLYFLSPLISPKKIDVKGSHCLITGGSSGIGRALAAEVTKRGGSVTLLARNKVKLEEAKQYAETCRLDPSSQSFQKVICVSADISKGYSDVEKAVKQAETELGPIDMLINSAGFSVSGKFEDTPLEDFKRLMDVNYIGSVYVTRAVINGMKERKKGRIVFVSSAAGQIGLFGYTAYSASKCALKGLAESLQMEVKPYNIRVTLAFPPDTDTPGYEEEMKTKPKETRLISETGGLFQAEYVAKVVLADAVCGKFQSYLGVDGWMLSCVTCGMSPVTSIIEATQQVFLVGIFRAIGLFYIRYFDGIVSKCHRERIKSQ